MNPNATWKPAAQGNYRSGRNSQISQITFHHIVGDAPAAIARFQTAGVEVSSTYVIGSDGTLYQCVKESDTPYTDANSASNARSITIEHAGGHANVPYTEAMYRASIALVADLIGRYGITSFKRHREVSDTPTACPGTLDVERIVREAKGGDMEIFNEGDRSNINVYLYGEDRGRFQAAVGKTWKEAIYFGIFETDEFNTDQRINAGDIGNMKQILGRDDIGGYVGKPWKEFFYGYGANLAAKPEFEPAPQLYIKK
jgi:hypothetical protein